MTIRPELERLCAHFGIAATYTDVNGVEHHANDRTRCQLLQALGVTAGDAASERQSLEQAIDQEWQQRLPPVMVHRQGDEPPLLNVSLPDDPALTQLRLLRREESGATAEASIDLSSLPVTERRELNGRLWLRRSIELRPPSEIGYHQLSLLPPQGEQPLAQMRLIVAPRRCWPLNDAERRQWGLVTQLHALRSGHNWGIGDLTDLTRLIEAAAQVGAGAIGLSPLHALFLTQPERCNPYEPSSRRFLNPLHIDVEAVPELADCEAARDKIDSDELNALLRALRGASLVDHAAITAAKLQILELLFRQFQQHDPGLTRPRAAAFQDFCIEQGEPLRRFALYQALSEYFAADRERLDYGQWPAAYRDPGSDQVALFAREHADRIQFFTWLEWIARQQLDAAGARCRALRMTQGLFLDLAVGVAPDGADHWALPDLYIRGAHVGAPPDDFSPKGQNWKVLAWHPTALRNAGYEPFAAELRANMRAAGGLRIDHVMGLMRLFLIPDGAPPTAGTYLAYPLEDLLAVLALESVRSQCAIVGEDLGTVPERIRAALPDWGILSMRVLYFERDRDGGFLDPAEFEPNAVVSAGTHDLPPLAGFWQGADLEQRRERELFPTEHDYDKRLLQRSNDRTLLFLALMREGLLVNQGGADPVDVPNLGPDHLAAIHIHLARTASRLLLIQTGDLLGETDQVNLPGSGDSYPNWRRRQPLELEHWLQRVDILALLAAVRAERGASLRNRSNSQGAAETTSAEAGAEASDARAAPPQTALQAPIPRATYRLQLHAGFGFADAAKLVPYLAQLGISHCYFSPYFKARPGSTHGYDVVDHGQLNPELGSREDYEQLCSQLAAHGMSQILDVVPNHVGIMGSENPWWLDVLENGPASAYADFFDIDWQPLKQELRGKVLVPVLGGHYGDVLDGGELQLVFERGAFHVSYYEHRFPIDPRDYPHILAPGLDALRERLEPDDPALARFETLVTAFANLPERSAIDQSSLTERHRDKEQHKQRLAQLHDEHADLQRYLQDCLHLFNGRQGYPADRARLHQLLEAQAYRLAHWRVAADEINYRRFFDINDLAALRMENAQAFNATHELVLRLIAEGRLQGLRIDHPDGLFDPAAYFRRLQQQVAAALYPQRPPLDADRPLYLAAEKILASDEQLRDDWPVHGTTGYDFATLCDALFVDTAGEPELDRCYRDFTGCRGAYDDQIYAAKKLVMKNLLSSELHRLASEAARIAEADPHTRDYTLESLRSALMEICACFPVYRTYISDQGVSATDRHQVLKAVSEARRRSHMPDLSVLDFARDLLLTDIGAGKPTWYQKRALHLAMKFQQYTSPVTAKGVEDTGFYRWHRLVSLNEVGGSPERVGISVDAFHRANARRQQHWPQAMLAGSTHDSKRSEDVRARLNVLSEMPERWREHVERWARLNRRLRRDRVAQDGAAAGVWPDANTEYLLYQTLVGVWPLQTPDSAGWQRLKQRIQDYMSKAVKEAKVHTAWTNADSDYEAALAAFIDSVLDADRSSAFFQDFIPFQQHIARIGLLNSLSQTLLRFTSPGLPDLYQGNELWDFSLVDPDNRRPVDFELRREWLAAIESSFDTSEPGGQPAAHKRPLFERLDDGSAKLYLIRRALQLRERMPEVFATGDYVPLTIEGPHADHLCGFSRSHQGRSVVVIAPRLLGALSTSDSDQAAEADPFQHPGWAHTWISIPAARLVDELSGSQVESEPEERAKGGWRLRASEVLGGFPVGLLTLAQDLD